MVSIGVYFWFYLGFELGSYLVSIRHLFGLYLVSFGRRCGFLLFFVFHVRSYAGSMLIRFCSCLVCILGFEFGIDLALILGSIRVLCWLYLVSIWVLFGF